MSRLRDDQCLHRRQKRVPEYLVVVVAENQSDGCIRTADVQFVSGPATALNSSVPPLFNTMLPVPADPACQNQRSTVESRPPVKPLMVLSVTVCVPFNVSGPEPLIVPLPPIV